VATMYEGCKVSNVRDRGSGWLPLADSRAPEKGRHRIAEFGW
jgi:hypothetical protein